ncbi:ABC transporter [Ornatilinea apprima]|uniref:ABC transporter n=2 Tax=Ornatilinea apprima TaxID=1134406 RepID=A0A0P6WKC3_9CHLR|nr:ABC transporter [Ornatilinea apprima]
MGLMHYFRSESEPTKVTWALMKRVLAYARPYGWKILGMLLLILVGTGFTLLTPLIIRELIDRAIPAGDLNRLVLLSLGLLLIPAIGGGVNVIRRKLNAQVGEGVIFDLRVALFSHIQRMSLNFFTHTRIGEIMSRLNNDVVGAQNAISNTIVNIITDLIEVVGVLAVMLTLEWRLTLVSIVILPLFLLAARALGSRLRDLAREQMDHNARMNAMINETLSIGGALLVKLFGRTTLEDERFTERASRVRDLGIRRAVVGNSFFVIIGLLSAVGTALVYGLGGYFVIQKAFTVGTIVAFGSYLSSLYGSLQGLATAPVEFATSVVSFERVFEVIDLPLEIQESPHPVTITQPRGELSFENVTFHYGIDEKNLLKDVRRYGQVDQVSAVLSGDAPQTAPALSQARETALEDISFSAHPGQLVALVGPSGAGKTTLTYLIPRLYDPGAGCVRLDGVDIRELSLDFLSSMIGMVTQETHLFHDTIRTNLIYAKLDASDQEIEDAARAANIHNFIAALPDGYNTIVGERGYRLSGGEKQRLALARVILKNPRILVLDEATSHLDSESESLIQEALRRVMAGRTSIVIAHRLSTILAADQILVIDRGRIVERGNHTSLLAAGGLYAHLYQTQFAEGHKPAANGQ